MGKVMQHKWPIEIESFQIGFLLSYAWGGWSPIKLEKENKKLLEIAVNCHLSVKLSKRCMLLKIVCPD